MSAGASEPILGAKKVFALPAGASHRENGRKAALHTCTGQLTGSTKMTKELEIALSRARTLPPEELPELLGELEQVRCTAMARLSAPAPLPAEPDQLLTIRPASQRLGVSPAYLYRHHAQLPFTRHVGRALRFSSLGIDDYIRRQGKLLVRSPSR